MAEHLQSHGAIELTPAVKTKLAQMSISTVRRLVPPSQRATTCIAHRQGQPRGVFAQPHAIPMRRIAWDEKGPGYFETDLVHPCGISASGQYVPTLQMIEVATGWSECVALLPGHAGRLSAHRRAPAFPDP